MGNELDQNTEIEPVISPQNCERIKSFVKIGVAIPMTYYPFSGLKENLFGDFHAQGSHVVELYTQTKVVVERWIRDCDRKF